MRVVTGLALALHCVLAAAAAPSAGATGPAAASARTTKAQIPDPTRTAPAQLWEDFLANSDYAPVERAMALVDSLEQEGSNGAAVDAGACRKQRGAIDASLREVPVSLALWFASYRCAQATGETARAERDLQAFHALVKHAFDSLPNDNNTTPVRVVSERDVDAFVRASGQEIAFAYYDVVQGDQPTLPLVMSLWDAQAQRERLVSFDFFSSFLRLRKNQRYGEFPLFQRTLRKKLLESMAKTPGSAADSGMSVQKALELPNPAARIAALKVAAEQHFSAAMVLGLACLAMEEKADCAGDAVDALLPWAEQHSALAMTLLAMAYEKGQGTKQDVDAAKALIEAADRRLGEHRATLFYAATTSRGHRPISAVVAVTLDKLAQEGNVLAETYLVSKAAAAKQPLTEQQRKSLEHAAAEGVPTAQALLGAVLLVDSKPEAALPWLEKAAAVDIASAQVALGRLYAKGLGVKADADKALYWNMRAGQGGDMDAMLRVARHWLAQPDSADSRFHAQGWLQSAATLGKPEAIRELADLYATGAEGLDGDTKEALLILRDLAKRADEAPTRRQLARLLVREKTATADERSEAQRLLQQDAKAGDAISQFQLGNFLLNGKLGKEDRSAGLRWARKAAEHNQDAAVFMAGVVYYGRFGVRRNPAEGIAQWRKLVAEGATQASNNLAWALCTVREDKLRDPAAGLAVADSMEAAGRDLPLAYLDTIAACHAAKGDFSGALERERRALTAAQERQPGLADFVTRANARIADYSAGRAYIEAPGDED